jgi:methionyl-tRNA synthetase
LVEGKCPDCGREVELLKEESYFFRLSKYADRLLEHIEAHPEFIQPVSRRNEMINNFLRPGLEDLCVSRTTFSWGIPVPFDTKHVVYVWLDALTNYITALGYPDEPELFNRYWPADLHLVGKEIVRFHTIIWPIILMALDLPLPRQVFGHGWLVLEGGKMSKSKGNVVDPVVLVDKYGLDAVRYYLLREMPFGADGVYAEDALILRINNDLANDLGNLLHRTVSMIEKFAGGTVPAPNTYEDLDREVIDQAAAALRERKECLEKLEVSNALAAIFRLVEKTNKYIDSAAPWALNKAGNRERLATVLYTMAESLRVTALLLTPFLVETPGKIWAQLGLAGDPAALNPEVEAVWGRFPAGTRVEKGAPLFPRIETEKTEGGPEKATPVGEKSKAQGAEGQAKAATEAKLPSQPAAAPEDAGLITIEEFARVDLRVAKVLAAERVPETDKLLKLVIKLGGEERQLVAGIGQYYEPSALIGREIVVVANLKPAKIRGLLSQGMLLAAAHDGKLALVVPEKPVGEGAKIQ